MPGNVAFQDSGSFLSVAPGTGPYEYPAPMGGATYGLRALATPRAEVAGDPQNPLATEDLATILERDDAQKLLEGAGLSEAEDIRWLAGPEELETAGGKLQDHANPDLADSDGEYRTFTGVVNSRENTEVNWLVALHVARVESDGDVVIAGGVNRIWVPFRGPYDEMIPTDTEETPWGPWFNSGAEMTAACLNRLARREELS